METGSPLTGRLAGTAIPSCAKSISNMIISPPPMVRPGMERQSHRRGLTSAATCRRIELIAAPSDPLTRCDQSNWKFLWSRIGGYIDSYRSRTGPYDPSRITNPSDPRYVDSQSGTVQIDNATVTIFRDHLRKPLHQWRQRAHKENAQRSRHHRQQCAIDASPIGHAEPSLRLKPSLPFV